MGNTKRKRITDVRSLTSLHLPIDSMLIKSCLWLASHVLESLVRILWLHAYLHLVVLLQAIYEVRSIP